jgi:hypothetical protein
VISRFRIVCLPSLYKNVNTKYAYEAIIMAAICLGVKLDCHMKIRRYTEGVRGRGAEENVDQPGECNKKLSKIAR